jgi:hypothetical protein
MSYGKILRARLQLRYAITRDGKIQRASETGIEKQLDTQPPPLARLRDSRLHQSLQLGVLRFQSAKPLRLGGLQPRIWSNFERDGPMLRRRRTVRGKPLVVTLLEPK